jgi:beta-glucosidase
LKNDIVFPSDFIWGTAVCSHQADGYNEHSDWWRWEKQGKIYDGTVSGPAADMWNQYKNDFAFMQEQGYNGFRLSVEWSRIEPQNGRFDEDALAHLEDMLAELQMRNIKVCLTLYHWVLPAWFADRGGWTSRDCVERFRAFVRRVVQRVYDKVDLWCTLNEPSAPLFAGYTLGVFPPEKRSLRLTGVVFKNLMRAHAAAYEEIMGEAQRRRDTQTPLIGIAHAVTYIESAHPENPLDRKLHEFMHYMHNVIFLDAMKTGRIPLPFGLNEKIPGLAGSYTYLGVNYYYRMRLQIPPKRWPPEDLVDFLYLPKGTETTGMGYEVYPPGFVKVMEFMSEYGVPLYVTENGCADDHDEQRPGYLLRHFAQMRHAMDKGIDVRGYFLWSYIDNFEWRYGYQKKLGLVELDRDTLERRPRPSAYMYGEIARSGKITEEIVNKYAPHVVDKVWGE